MEAEKNLLAPEQNKIIQKLYVFAHSPHPQLNQQLQLVVNPEIIKILLEQAKDSSLDIKLQLLNTLTTLYQQNQFNSLILAKRDAEIMEFNHSILQFIIEFILALSIDMQQAETTAQLLTPFVKLYPVNCKIIKAILSPLIKDFHQEKITPRILKMTILVLKTVLQQQKNTENQPQNYFINYGEEGGLKMLQSRIKWPFSKGFHLYLKFNIQNTIKEDMILFSLSIEQDDFIVAVTPQGQLKVKIFGSNEPLIICGLPIQQWITLSLHYTIKNQLFRNYYELKCVIEGQLHERKNLPVPSISMTDEILELAVARNLYGKIHIFLLSRAQLVLGNKLIMNNWKQIQSFLVINKKNLREIFAFHTPVLTTTTADHKNIVYDISSQNHAEMLQNCGVHYSPFREVDINYYGGLYTYLPFLHLLKFYQPQHYPQALTHIFELYLLFFQLQFQNTELESINCAFLSIASQLINQLNPKFLQPQTINIIKQLNFRLTNPQLKQQMLRNFLFKIKIKQIQDHTIINRLLQIVELYFLKEFEWTYQLLPLDEILHYIVDNFEEKEKEHCCQYHFQSTCKTKEKEEEETVKFNNQYHKKTAAIQNILKVVLHNLPKHPNCKPVQTKLMDALLYNYSPCFKLLLLQTLTEALKSHPQFYIEELNVVPYIYEYLQRAQFPQQIIYLIEMLMACQLQDSQNQPLKISNIHAIASSFKKIHNDNQSAIQNNPTGSHRRRTRRFSSLDHRDLKPEGIQQKLKKKTSALKPKHQPLHSNKNLYQTILKLCFQFSNKEEEWLLKEDDFCLILQPYFKLICPEFRKNIINMLRNTIVINYHRKPNPSQQQFTQLYKLLLTEFVLKELEPNQNQKSLNDNNNDIIRNIYFIIDYTVINMREDWIHLYLYLLELSGILEEVKKDIALTTHRTIQNINMAAKLANRKFVSRVVKLAQKNIANIPNLIFLVSLIVFGNQEQQQKSSVFKYFKSMESRLLIADQEPAFVDFKLILETVNSFKIDQYDLVNSPPHQVQKMVKAYLDLQYTQDSELFACRQLYLSKAEFKQLKPTLNTYFQLFKQEHKDNIISTGQIISAMICLCVEASLNTRDFQSLHEALESLKDFFLWFLLLSSRDRPTQEQRSDKKEELPKAIASNVLHFLYTMLSISYPPQFLQILENTLCQIFVFLGILTRCLNQKLGCQQNFEKALQKAAVVKDAEQYNFYAFDLVKEVLALSDLQSLPDISYDKVVGLLRHPKVSDYFKNKLSFSIEPKIQEVITKHNKNAIDVRQQIEMFFTNSNPQSKGQSFLNELDFAKQFEQQQLKKNNLNYRRTQRIWIKIWKRLRMYHYFWSVSMNQREDHDLPYQKNNQLPYRHKFSKFLDQNGARPVLEVEHLEPWHVKKVLMQKQFQYRNSNYLYHLHEEVELKKKEKTFLQKLMKSTTATLFFVDWIKHNSKRKGYLSIENEKLKFKYLSTFQKDSHLEFSSFVLAQYKPIQKFWPLVEINNIMQRRYLTKRQCLLIEFQEGTSLIFNFLNEDKDQFMKLIEAKQNKIDKNSIIKLNKIAFYSKKFNINSLDGLEEAHSLWKNHKISNFRYLMVVNKYAGRNYLDPANYPVFPWILTDYNNNHQQYRDLSKTVGALGNQERIEFFKGKIKNTDPFDQVPPYQFGTHYSSPGVVFNFLVRLQPYTDASRTLQGGRFDLPDRLFSSLKVCWNSVTSEVSDVRELTPQFYYLPQSLLNIDHHDFGTTQQKDRVHNVQLPEWSSSAYDFIVKHRQELQSDYVSENIGNWIDLIFGYKQKGKIAEENLNLYYYLTYQDAIELKNIPDQQTRISKEAQIMHFGQTPSQLWTKPHGGKPRIKQPTLNLNKILLIFSMENPSPLSILSVKDNKLILFQDYNVAICLQQGTYHIDKQVKILRNNSKQSIYFLEDIEFHKRIQIFNKQKYIAVASYVNGDLLVFSLSEGKKVEQKKGTPKLCLLVNEKQDLMLVGNKNGLLEVFQIVYGEKETLTLIKIAAEYYMAPIHSINQGGNFFCIASGSLVTLIRASRSLNYVYDKFKMRGVKMIRSIETSKKVEECIISTDPLFCLVIYTSLELNCYSGNGQLLATKQVQLNFPPIKFTQNFMDYLAYVQNTRLKILSLPFLTEMKQLQLPNKRFTELKFFQGKCYLATPLGQILSLSEDSQQTI